MTEVVMSRKEWLKTACQRTHLDDASVKELLVAINKAATVPNTPFGPMKVFREYVVRKSAIEYTCFFDEDGTKMRVDMEVTEEELNEVPEDHLEEYVSEKVYAIIRDHQARPATEYWNGL